MFAPDFLKSSFRAANPDGTVGSARFRVDRHPMSGVASHVLETDLSPRIQSFYFVNDGFSADGRFLWFYASSTGPRSLGVVDFGTGQCRLVPDSDFLDASPLVDLRTGDALWIRGTTLHRCSAGSADTPRQLTSMPPAWVRGEDPFRISTHLTWRADHGALTLDAQFHRRWFAGEIVLADGSWNVWKTFDRCYNHAQFSPVDPDLQLIAQDGWTDAQTGEAFSYDRRMWLLMRDGGCEPLYAHPTPWHGHEWWDAGGRHVWFVHYGQGVKRTEIQSHREEVVWPGAFSHAHASMDGRFVVADSEASGRTPACRVRFLNRTTGRSVWVADHPWPGNAADWRCHVHPHPRFALGDRWIHYTTFAGGKVGLALVPVQELIAATA